MSKYQELFDYLANEYDIILLDSEIEEIIYIVSKIDKE